MAVLSEKVVDNRSHIPLENYNNHNSRLLKLLTCDDMKNLLRLLLRRLLRASCSCYRRQASVELPDDIIYSILLKLPKKSLMRFRALSKEWNGRITSRSFSMDYKLTGPDPKVSNIFYFSSEPLKEKSGLPGFRIWGGRFQHRRARRLPYPFHRECCEGEYRQATYLSCDGLLCFVCNRRDRPCPVTVWNPYTRQHAEVPAPPEWQSNLGWFGFVGFGYDPAADDYKIVIIDSTPFASASRVIVTGLKSGSWRVVGTAALDIFHSGRELKTVSSADGHVWWIGQKYCLNSFVSLSFSLAEEKASIFSLPPEINCRSPDWTEAVSLHHHEESIYLFYREWVSDMTVWKLVRHGRAARWEIAERIRAKHPMKMIGITGNGDFLMRICGDLYAYVRSEKKLVGINVDGNILPEDCNRCRIHLLPMETLISP